MPLDTVIRYREQLAQIDFWVLIDLLLVSWVLYHLLVLLKGTRAVQLVKGVLFLLVVYQLSDWLSLDAFHWLLGQMLIPGVVALVILFQPELRLALEQMGRGRFIPGTSAFRGAVPIAVNELIGSVEYLAGHKYGAIIVLENRVGLQDIVESGKRINGAVSASLLNTIFYPGSPLHDGAVVVRGTQVLAAGCILPLTNRATLPSAFGLRHRAALGVSEASDALVIVVSEESGNISIAQGGTINSRLKVDALRDHLLSLLQPTAKQPTSSRRWFRAGNREGSS
ncbi:MAG: TIGR00159 family protein [Armatimonadetes bacterium CG2_30_59_28]|nr:TIGR00159 family protein [Armatimonadota bacterium]OIO94863.1 MAG: TIGR00159 family protein [Armatimonadetes bacterium CG2_30_59_28]PIU65919.1 MAG: TIGR00159 family protein [Armatimonadetes bacterium CG07_land_8_20_14_0_80_59_28]PIX40941.1 MAG: TIGR00159 family protein [Armatimonadetes bacterium CG_4_8_14_3_um_filter_58_9]PIY48264.1 MAG: TIGR00159 family protein [Armatimonadetes bacterium CG_4_10_14_3_um_filter_59_10]